jgi:hypothetical protein
MEQNVQQVENKSPNKTKNELSLIIVAAFFMISGIVWAICAYKMDQANPNDPLGLSGLPFLASLVSLLIAFVILFFSALLFRNKIKFFIINIIILIMTGLMATGVIYFFNK